MTMPRGAGERTGVGHGHARYSFRVRVSSTALEGLLKEWARCRWVWNECVATSRTAHTSGTSSERRPACGPALLDKMLTEARARLEWLRAGSSVAQQQVVRDFAKARAKALKDRGDGLPAHRRAGFPRFKKKDTSRPSMNYTRRGFRLKNGRLHLAGGITLTVVWSRELGAEPSSVRIHQDSVGDWYASFVVPGRAEPLPKTGRTLGVDWGVRDIATTTSDAHDLPHPEHGRAARKEIGRYQRMMARRKPAEGQAASRGYREAKRQVAKVYRKVARRRQDGARKWAKSVMRDHDVIAVEDFRPRFLARSSLARKAADAAIGAARTALLDMARKHGRDVRLIPPVHTTMDCAECGARAKRPLALSERIYTCTACGATSPRDKNSARVMLVRAGLVPVGADGARPGGTRFRRAT
ncbi:RNA-guided endonuclease InsQ/TnpB family protein [Streptomyces koyangensis]